MFNYIVLNLKTRRFFCFSGRSVRSEYIIYFLFMMIANIALAIAGPILIAVFGAIFSSFGLGLIIIAAYCLLVIYINFPIMPITFRRLHDIGLSGMWFFVPTLLVIPAALLMLTKIISDKDLVMKLIEFIGLLGSMCQLVVFVACVFVKGDVGVNKYGPEPL